MADRHEVVPGGVVLRREEPHRCPTPEPRRFDPGDVFICGECKRNHVLVDAQGYQGGPYWKPQEETR